MFRKIGRGIKKLGVTFLNFPAWMNLPLLKNFAKDTKSILLNLFVIQQSDKTETFDDALNRLNLNEQQIQEKKRAFKRLLILMGVLLIITMGYLIYVITQGHWRAVIVCLGLITIIASFMFRYHFWYFQIEHRRLGLTFKDWVRYLLNARK